VLKVSVIIPTYNPCLDRLNQTLLALKQQSLSASKWELIIIDNNSSENFEQRLDLSWHPTAKIVREPKQGLTYARLKGMYESHTDILVMVDDDNVLDSTYLENILILFHQHPQIAAVGGKTVPFFEASPPIWLEEFKGSLALRDLGDVALLSGWENSYPDCAPIGAGMGLRKEALQSYIGKITSGREGFSDRKGDQLSSGGDNDIVVEILKSGWQVGYFPQLTLRHIIPAERMTVKYLARLVNHTNKSWMQLLSAHQMNPWPPVTKTGALLRKAKAWITYMAWLNGPCYIRWRGACGAFDGRSSKAQM
jgi:glycosyltransferase involved in cell wall biosynthesis